MGAAISSPPSLSTDAVLEGPAESSLKKTASITYLPVDDTGKVDPDDVKDAIRGDSLLISIMAANNEIGTIAPLEEIGEIAKDNQVFLHADAVQALGNIDLDA
ncbi:MAG: aminotransferase class V-fold PLP-dependent enzyme [Natrialbaceae archaeon]|nr:aminotransferase class V-fold PLP-dependent enzyme [Natrialbaceae archaeon]